MDGTYCVMCPSCSKFLTIQVKLRVLVLKKKKNDENVGMLNRFYWQTIKSEEKRQQLLLFDKLLFNNFLADLLLLAIILSSLNKCMSIRSSHPEQSISKRSLDFAPSAYHSRMVDVTSIFCHPNDDIRMFFIALSFICLLKSC